MVATVSVSSTAETSRSFHHESARSPALAVAVAVCVGVLLSAMTTTSSLAFGLAALLGLLAWLAGRWIGPVPATVGLLIAAASLSGWWYDLRVENVPADNIRWIATDEGRVVQLTGIVRDNPEWSPPPPQRLSWQREGTTRFTIRVETVQLRSAAISAGGVVQVQLDGQVESVAIGDRVRIVGKLRSLPQPRNPGEFDFGQWLQRQGVSALLMVDSPEAVLSRAPASGLRERLLAWQSAARTRAARAFASLEDERTRAIAMTMFLGERRQLPEETRRDFAETGTAHLLAISGLNVVILAGWFWLMGTILGLRERGRRWLMGVGLLAYALLAVASPPVLRATLIALFALFASGVGRMVSGRQLVSVAVILLVVADPGCLFDVGAQLSFLAVLAIAAVREWSLAHPADSDALTPDATVVSPFWRSAVRHLALLYAVMLAVWLVTTPLVAARFHVASVSALLLNVVISPYVGLLMLAGYSQLVLGMMWPGFADFVSPVLEALLGGLLDTVSWVASWSVASVATPGPSQGWLAVFYLLLAPVLLMVRSARWRAWSLRLAGVWVAVGLVGGHLAPRPRELVVSVASVGHGLAVVVAFPNGATLTYDAGGSGRPSRIAEVMASAIWQEGRSRVDCAILSHSDLDHCQALPPLLELLPVGTVVLPQAFLDFTQPVVNDIVSAASQRKTPLRVLAAGQRLQLDDDVRISVLHPAPRREYGSDNAASLVVLLEYAGRRILLTGDLERDGLEAFLRQAPMPVDVLLSPHHGSRRANTPDLARWASPDWVIASGFDNDLRPHLDTVYGGVPVLFTSRVGAVRVAIGESGDVVVRPFRYKE